MLILRRALFCLALTAYAEITQAIPPPPERDAVTRFGLTTGAWNPIIWIRRDNWTPDDTANPCTFYGIICDPGETHIIGIDLLSNGLQGTLPTADVWAALPSLEGIRVSGNALLAGGIPDISRLTHLRVFNIAGCAFIGTIPSVNTLSNLEVFDVSYNQLTGEIPRLTGLANLVHFDVSANHLTGVIPSLQDLTRINRFLAYDNSLSGPIPNLFGLSNLEYLWLYKNNLTGPLPSSLTGLPSLKSLYVGSNHLTGAPPAPPNSLLLSQISGLCPNPFDLKTHPSDHAWEIATGHSPWWELPGAASCNVVFGNGFDAL